MKRTLALILALALCLSLAVPAAAAGSGMDNFQKTNTYTGQFADIPENYWGTKWATVCFLPPVSETESGRFIYAKIELFL